jgi:hypothetical protein
MRIYRRDWPRSVGLRLLLASGLIAGLGTAHASDPVAEPGSGLSSLPDTVVEAPEPRYVAPTLHDRIGRIWAPVLINDRGPFRLVLDTGASRSAITPSVLAALGPDARDIQAVRLRGVTGTKDVGAVAVDSIVVGDLELRPARLPILPDAFGGAEGILGTDGMLDMRIFIDFRHDKITIRRSHNERAPAGFVTIPVRIVGGLIIIMDARFGSIPVQAIVDTGGQVTIANAALGEALRHQIRQQQPGASTITGATLDDETGDLVSTPPLTLGTLRVSTHKITVGDMYIFKHWRMTSRPALLIGMDILGLLDTMIIDYKQRVLVLQTRADGS